MQKNKPKSRQKPADDKLNQNQLPTSDFSVHNAFLAAVNLVHILIRSNQQLTLKQASTENFKIFSDFIADSADSAEFERVDAKQWPSKSFSLGLAAHLTTDLIFSDLIAAEKVVSSKEGI